MEGFLLGLTTGSYCLTACAPGVLPLFLSENMDGRRNAVLVGMLFLGRLAAYLAVGFVLGALGAYEQHYIDPGTQRLFSRLSNVFIGLILILGGLRHNFATVPFCRLVTKPYRTKAGALALGVLTGLSLCPPFFAASARVFGLSSSLEGAVYFFFFFLGTSVWLLPFWGVHFLSRRSCVVRMAARTAMLLLGVYFFLIPGVLGLV